MPRSSAPTLALILTFAGVPALPGALTPAQQALLPPPASRPVDFVRDIQPIFEASCVQCHGRGKAKGSFSLETRADFLLGGDTGAPAIAGKSAESLVVEMISGLTPDLLMPQKGKKLTSEQVALFRAWIDQGLPWPKEITFLRQEPANLRPTEVTPPPARNGLEHPVDRIVDAYFAKQGFAWPKAVDDRTYARRVWLDAIGVLPTPAELDAFVADRAPDKRLQLVRRLLGDSQRYAEHWLTFWNDLLRNDYKGTGYIDGGRKQITGWLYSALARNVPYDRFVAELLHPGAEAEGFTKGILWRGAVNASMVPPMQAAQGIAQVFLGVNLKCASCHDSFINEYTLADAYGLASIYADGPLEIAECDKPTGHTAKVKFLYEEIGSITGESGPAARQQQLAEIITGRKNGRLPRTIVNRLWQRFVGYGLVEPVDEMDRPAWSPELLHWLAEDLVAHGYDLKHTMTRILTSRTYQLPAVNVGETEENYVFRGPAVRRLSAEQFSDALLTLTRTTLPKADARFNRQVALAAPAKPDLPRQPRWIWNARDAHVSAPPANLVFRRTFEVQGSPTEAVLALAADDNYNVRINGKAAGSSGRRNSTLADFYDIRSLLKAGSNEIEVTAGNVGPDDGRISPDGPRPNPDSPAGLIVYARIRSADTVQDFVSDASWQVRPAGQTGGTNGTATEPAAAVELGGVDLAPWRLGSHFLAVAGATKDELPVERSALVAADPLMVALGRPNREQIVTVRQTTPTTLQALELTNGGTLAALLKSGAPRLLNGENPDPRALVTGLYQQAISRAPTARELELALSVVGSPVRADGVEDLLWALVMLPEFQLIL
jgi:mono/diheme cytochrome c family protein